jgi:ubiquinone/menaquinone biosynthesis C-methylase UbiE
MARTAEEQAAFDRFSKRYAHAQCDLMRKIERSVCGCDYGATSWATIDEARKIAKILALKPGMRILDVGSGSGWPGVFLAKETGCDIVLTDLPLTGLRVALERTATDNISEACSATVADGAALPFGDASFDAIIHSDVLCCLPDKLGVLQSCRRVIGGAGKMVFSVIFIRPGLSPGQYDQAVAAGPRFIESETSYMQMLEKAGWKITDQQDLSGAYQQSIGRSLEKLETHSGELADLIGADDVAGDLALRRATWQALEQNLLQRQLFSVVPFRVAPSK